MKTIPTRLGLLALCLLLAVSGPALAESTRGGGYPAAQLGPFTDVDSGDWFYPYVSYVYYEGLFVGATEDKFDPDGTLTRGMFVTVLGRFENIDTRAYEGELVFADLDTGEYYAPYVAWATELGIVTGYADGSFGPDRDISRQEMAAMIDRYLASQEVRFQPGADVIFRDIGEVEEFALSSVYAMAELGIITGDDYANFNPHQMTTRAEASAIFCRLAICMSDIAEGLLIPPGWTAVRENDDDQPVSVFMDMADGGAFSYVIYDDLENEVVDFGRNLTQSLSDGVFSDAGIPAGGRLVLTNTGSTLITLYRMGGRTWTADTPALKEITLPAGESCLVTNTSAVSAHFLAEADYGQVRYDAAQYSSDGALSWTSLESDLPQSFMSVPEDGHAIVTNQGDTDLTIAVPYDLFDLEESETQALINTVLAPGESCVLYNMTIFDTSIMLDALEDGFLFYGYTTYWPDGTERDSYSESGLNTPITPVPAGGHVIVTNIGDDPIRVTGAGSIFYLG